MTFKEVLAQVIDWLQQDKRLSYRALKRQFDLDDDYLDDLKVELIEARRVAVDEDGRVLVWVGDTVSASALPSVPTAPPARVPLTYTPPYLAEKILTSRSALEGERKQVTVLFADLKGSTELIHDLDPEAAQQLLDPALQPAHHGSPCHVSFETGESMAIEAIAMEGPEARVSEPVARLIETCSRGWERFFTDHDDQAPRFVPSVPERVFAVLAEVTTRNLPPTRVFCEWGSGFGTATCMAALLGYEAYGLEIDAELVRLSRAIARRLGIRVEILCTSLFPQGYEASSDVNGAALVTPASVRDHHTDEARGPLRYDGMEIAIADIGVFFAYPWPEEHELIRQLFDAVAREGAILVMYHTDTDIRVFRKVEGEVEL